MSRNALSVECPTCASTITVGAPIADGGAVDADEPDRLYGHECRCEACGREVEVMFYPR